MITRQGRFLAMAMAYYADEQPFTCPALGGGGSKKHVMVEKTMS
ncbi:MAG: hypothetical protein ACYDES_14195 [Acidimicrobiales bacterium]